jgi:hypothetical protein
MEIYLLVVFFVMLIYSFLLIKQIACKWLISESKLNIEIDEIIIYLLILAKANAAIEETRKSKDN